MTKLFIAGAIISLSLVAAAHADPKPINSGDGRFVCTGNSAACAQVDANNRQREAQRQYDNQRDQDRAQAYVDDQRRKDEERRNEQYRSR